MSPLSREETKKVEEHEHPLLAASGKVFMVNFTGDGDCAYSSVIASFKHAHCTDPGCFSEENYLRDLVVKNKTVALSIQKLRNRITEHGTQILYLNKGYSEADALAIFNSGLREEAEGNNYGGIMVINCLAHALDFPAVICDEIGGSKHYLRVDESELPFINVVRLNLLAGSKGEHTPLCSHPTVSRLKKEMKN